jgi:cardiolipin synthase
MYAAILEAKDHINMETYVMDDDEVGQRFAQVLIEKQQRGIQVNLIRDSAGTFNTPNVFFQKLTDSGVNVLEFNPLNPLISRKEWTLNQRDHRKLLIVDGGIAFLGGINISSVYSGGSFSQSSRKKSNGSLAWRDTDLQLKGPVVAEFQKLFLSTWEKQKGQALAPKNYFPPSLPMGKQVVRAIGSSPDEPFSAIYATLLSAIGNAAISVQLTNAYFAPDPQLLAALGAAARRGVDVKLILPSETDSWLVLHAGRAYYTQLLKSGVKIYHRQGVILHSKTALIDGVWATIGSTNLDWRSFLHNDELNAVILGAEFGQQVQAMFNKDLAASDAVILEQWERRTLDQRIKEFVAQLWEYWL